MSYAHFAASCTLRNEYTTIWFSEPSPSGPGSPRDDQQLESLTGVGQIVCNRSDHWVG